MCSLVISYHALQVNHNNYQNIIIVVTNTLLLKFQLFKYIISQIHTCTHAHTHTPKHTTLHYTQRGATVIITLTHNRDYNHIMTHIVHLKKSWDKTREHIY